MKKIYFLAIGLLSCASVMAQKSLGTENVGIGTSSPDYSAVLDIQSSNKGLLIPRLTLEQRNLIQSPAQGLMIYQVTGESGFYFYNGKTWKPLSQTDPKAIALDAANWSKTGDAGTNPSTNFLGTTDLQPLVFKTNGLNSGFIHPDGRLIFGAGTNSGGPAGSYNTAYGNQSLGVVSTGQYNVGVGAGSLSSLVSGNFNLALGTNAMLSNTNASLNIAVGTGALQKVSGLGSDGNMGLGTDALKNLTSGAYNAAVGFGALQGNAAGYSGNSNLALGAYALNSISGGSNNMAIGSLALFNNSSGSGNVAIGYLAGYNETGSNKLYIANTSSDMPLVYGDFSAKFVTIGDVPASNLKRIDAVTAGGYNLLVKGGILTEKVKVALVSTTDWADYVFEPSYKDKMMSLEEVEKYTKLNKHLPNVPSAQDMVDKGMEVGQTSKMFMEKIEELTLYMIELNKEVKALKAENEVLKRK